MLVNFTKRNVLYQRTSKIICGSRIQKGLKFTEMLFSFLNVYHVQEKCLIWQHIVMTDDQNVNFTVQSLKPVSTVEGNVFRHLIIILEAGFTVSTRETIMHGLNTKYDTLKG